MIIAVPRPVPVLVPVLAPVPVPEPYPVHTIFCHSFQ